METSRRDFLKLLGISATVAAAPNVLITPQVQALEIPEAVVLDPLKLYYEIDSLQFSVGILKHVETKFEREIINISGYPPYPGRKISYPLELTLESELQEIQNIRKAIMDVIDPPQGFSYNKNYKGKLHGVISVNLPNNSQLVIFESVGFFSELSDVKINAETNTIFSKFVYDTVKVDYM